MTPTIYALSFSGAGREVENAPLFLNMTDLREYLYAYAKASYESQKGGNFDLAHGVAKSDRDSKWRAAVDWAVTSGGGDWAIIAAQPAHGVGEKPFHSQPSVVALDADYLGKIRAERIAIKSLNEAQKIALTTYGGGDYAHLAEGLAEDEFWREVDSVGDSHLRFILVELDEKEDCDTLEEATNRMRSAAGELTTIADECQDAPAQKP